MIPLNLSKTSQEILSIMLRDKERGYYVNELIRLTGRYPNSIHKSLITLERQGFVKSKKVGNRKFHKIVKKHKYRSTVEKIIGVEDFSKDEPAESEWIKLVNRGASLALTNEITISNYENLKSLIGYSADHYWYNSVTGGVYYKKEEVSKVGEIISQKAREDTEFSSYIADECRERADALVSFSKRISKLDLVDYSNKKLANLIKKFRYQLRELLPFLIVPHSVERVILSEIEEDLRKALLKVGGIKSFEKYLEALVTPASDYAEERNAALKIALYIKEHSMTNKAKTLISKHTNNYRWIPLFNLTEELLTESYFLEEIQNIIKHVRNPKEELKNSGEFGKKRRKEIEVVFKKIGAGKELRDKVKILQSYIYLRTYRRDAIAQANYYHLPVINEVAKRMDISVDKAKLVTYEEMINFLVGGRILSLEVINERSIAWASICMKGKQKVISGMENIIGAIERNRIVPLASDLQKTLRGRAACRGQVTGRVKIVRKLSELEKVQKGDVLVARMTTPDYMVAVHKAAAIVTDEGGVTCHAAIVSREYNLPCIVGTKNATNLLSDNDLVEVNAEEGIVRAIESVEIDEDVKEIYGKTAYKGKVKGKARIVLDANDFTKVQEGDVLVASQTTPEYLSSLYKVGGFIVDEDSITSHAMLYAKALKVPAIIGTGFARNVLEDGEQIELDATKGLIRRIK